MLDKLFGSYTRVKILELFFTSPEKDFYVQETARILDLDAPGAHRELKHLEDIGILKSQKIGKQLHYSLNQKNLLVDELGQLVITYLEETQKKWINHGRVVDCYPISVTPSMHPDLINRSLKLLGIKPIISKTLTSWNNRDLYGYLLAKEHDTLIKETKQKMIDEPGKILEALRVNHIILTNLSEYILEVKAKNFSELSDSEIIEIIENLVNLEFESAVYYWTYLTLEHSNQEIILSYHKSIVNLKDSEYDSNTTVNNKLIASTISVLDHTEADEAHQGFLKIVSHLIQNLKTLDFIRNNEVRIISQQLIEIDTELAKLVNKQTIQYGNLGYGRWGPGWDQKYYLENLKTISELSTNKIKYLLTQSGSRKQKLLKEQKDNNDLIREQFPKLKHQLEAYQQLVKFKITHKELEYKVYNISEYLFKELASRWNKDWSQIRLGYLEELKEMQNYTELEIRSLNQPSLYLQKKNSKTKILRGENIENFLKKQKLPPISEVVSKHTIYGDILDSGRITGIATRQFSNQLHDILIMDTKDWSLDLDLNTISGLIITGDRTKAISISSQFILLGIPTIYTSMDISDIKAGSLIDLDATHGKARVIWR